MVATMSHEWEIVNRLEWDWMRETGDDFEKLEPTTREGKPVPV